MALKARSTFYRAVSYEMYVHPWSGSIPSVRHFDIREL